MRRFPIDVNGGADTIRIGVCCILFHSQRADQVVQDLLGNFGRGGFAVGPASAAKIVHSQDDVLDIVANAPAPRVVVTAPGFDIIRQRIYYLLCFAR